MRWADAILGGATNARDFPGANRIDLTGSGPQITGNRITLSAWGLIDSGTNKYAIARWNGAPGTSSYAMAMNPASALIHDGAGQDTLAGVQTFPLGGSMLHHWCVVKDGATLRGYVDGKLDHHIASTRSLQNAGTPCLGDVALAAPTNGAIRHAAIWDEALSPWEVMQLAQGVAPWDVRGAKLRVWIPLNDWAGGTGNARDLSTRNSTATPAGGTTYTLRPGSPTPMPVDPLLFLQHELPPLLEVPIHHVTQVVSA